MNVKYLFGTILAIPLLPVMYFQGKKIKSSVPKLPEAEGVEGLVGVSDRTLTLLTIGESTIAGVGVATHEEGFTGTLASELSQKLEATINWKVYAKSGYNAQKVKEKIVPEITEESVDIIVIGLGGNDAFELNSPQKWRTQTQGLINELRSRYKETPIIFANMPPIKEFPAFTRLIKFTIGNLVEILGDELEKLVINNHGVYYHARRITVKDWIDKMDVDIQPSDFFSDGVHPSKLTYQVWARDLADFLIRDTALNEKLMNENNENSTLSK